MASDRHRDRRARALAEPVVSPADLAQQRARLDRARTRVRTGLLRGGLIVLLTSLCGIAAVWLLELAGADAAVETVLAGVLLVTWMVSGAGALLALVLLAIAAVTSAGLQVWEQSGNTGNEIGDRERADV